jgi:hypothetical protein
MKQLNFFALPIFFGALVTGSLSSQSMPSAQITDKFKAILPRLQSQSDLTIRLPSYLPPEIQKQQIFVRGQSSNMGYRVDLESHPDCNGANACFIGVFGASLRNRPTFDQAVPLARGITAYYQPLRCGGSCSPPAIEWIQERVLYSIQMRVSRDPIEAKQTMIQLANSSINQKVQNSEGKARAKEVMLTASTSGAKITLHANPDSTSRSLGYGLVGDQVKSLQQTVGKDNHIWYQVLFPTSGAIGWIQDSFIK